VHKIIWFGVELVMRRELGYLSSVFTGTRAKTHQSNHILKMILKSSKHD